MSTFGEVVYCKDCDLARAAAAEVAFANGGSPVADHPRRMATKKDANGDPLCTACLDARVEKRRAAFLLHEGRAPLPPPRPVRSFEPTTKRMEVATIRVRDRGVEARPEPAPRSRAKTDSPRRKRRAREAPTAVAVRSSKRDVRAKERRFAMLAAEIGFLRAQQLLGALAAHGRR